jgi:hypothetical protein
VLRPRGTPAGPFFLAVLDRAGDTFRLGQIVSEHPTLAEVAAAARAYRGPAQPGATVAGLLALIDLFGPPQEPAPDGAPEHIG